MIASLTPHTLANDARMRRALFSGVFLFVEGTSDEKFYGKFLSPDCQAIICHGRGNVRDTCRILAEANFRGAVGIIDADFNHLEGKTSGIPSVFQTDMHDAESYMLSTLAFHALIQEFATAEKLRSWQAKYSEDLRGHIVQQAAAVSSLLWHTLEKGLELCFHDLDPKEYLSEDSLKIDLTRLVRHVKNKSQRQDLPDDQLINAIQDKIKKRHDLWQLARSHDITQIIGFALRRTLGNWRAQDVSVERIEQCLRLAYSDDLFSETRLCGEVRNWESSSSSFQVFRRFQQRELNFCRS